MVLENRVAFAQGQLIARDELRSRWQHATEEEFYDLFASGKLHVFSHVKGPINDVIFCVPGMYDTGFENVYWGGFDYCLLSEVEQCEKEYPDFLGNVGVLIVAALGKDKETGLDQIRYTIGKTDAASRAEVDSMMANLGTSATGTEVPEYLKKLSDIQDTIEDKAAMGSANIWPYATG